MINGLKKGLLSLSTLALVSFTPLTIADQSQTLERKIETIIPTRTTKKIVSVDLGNPSDQYVFLNYFKKHNPNVQVYAGYNNTFLIPEDKRDAECIQDYATRTAITIDDKLQGARYVHFSGHHFVNEPRIIFGGSSEHRDYGFSSAIDLTELTTHEETDIVFLNACFTVDILNNFTTNLFDKFPNALLLGYRKRSAPDEANANLLRHFFKNIHNRNISEISKPELSKLWVDAGRKTYLEMGQVRDIRAAWKQGNVLYELNSVDGNLYVRYLK